MDYLKQQLDRMQKQLAALTASQKMLTVTLVAIMVATLLWWARYAGKPELEPVLDQSFSSDDMPRITAKLASKGIVYRVVGDRVLVPAERKFEVLAELGYAQLLPRDTKSGFDEIINKISPWDSAAKTSAMWNKAKEAALAQVLRNFPAVANAVVLIDPTRERRVEGSIQPSATVNITMRDAHPPSKHLINAAADLVAGAQSGLARSRIAVIVNGVSHRVHDSEDGSVPANGEIIELQQQYERLYSRKISDQLLFIPNVMVSVTVSLNTRSSHKTERTVDPNRFLHKELEIESQTEESSASGDGAGEPGVAANTAAAIPANSGGGGANSTSEKSRTKFSLIPSDSVEVTKTPAGDATVVAASVRVPRSYFVEMYRKLRPTADEPDDAALEPLVSAELGKIRRDVKACTGLKNDADVTVDTYIDTSAVMAAASQTTVVTPFSAGDYVKEIALGVLAVISVLMVSMMVRKGGAGPAGTTSAASVGETRGLIPRLSAGETLAGQAGEEAAVLAGMELDEESVRAQQVVDQVSAMVRDNPDAAAGLVKRWLVKS